VTHLEATQPNPGVARQERSTAAITHPRTAPEILGSIVDPNDSPTEIRMGTILPRPPGHCNDVQSDHQRTT